MVGTRAASLDGMTPTSDQPGLRANLVLEHEEIDRALARLVEAFGTGDRDVARDAFREFDTRLSTHLAFEEQVLLPEFAAFDPGEAAKIVDEHRIIRAAIDELGIGTDLHLTRAPAIRKLAETLLAHARRENALFYRWVDAHPWPRGSERPVPEAPAASSRT